MATIRGTGMQASSASSYVVPWPTGTVAGDLAVIMCGHGWDTAAPSGWTTNDNQTGANWNGAVFSKVLTGADMSAGSVTIGFAGSFNGTIAIITFVGSSGFNVGSVVSARNSAGSASVPLSVTLGSSFVAPSIYFGSNRAASTDTVDRGTMQRQSNDGSAASGCLYSETGVSGSVTATFQYSVAGSGNYQAIIVLGTVAMPLSLACAGSATLSSAYFVVWVSRKDVATGDLPPGFGTQLNGITTLDVNRASWGMTPMLPTPSMGTWSPSVTYALGDTVASAAYRIRSADSTLNLPIVYRSLTAGNLGNKPEAWDGKWTCETQPPHNDVNNKNFDVCPFGYILSPLPTKTALGSATWDGSLGHSLFWDVSPPGDIVQLIDIYVLLNYLVGASITHMISRPLGHTIPTTGTQGLIVNPGINTQWQCWHTSGLSTTPEVTLNSFDLGAFVDGFQPGATVGTAYLTTLVASGGTTPYAYAIIAGSLPPGVTLDGTTGVISGVPTSSGIFDFTAQVTDNAGATATVTCAAPIECSAGAAAANNSFY